MSFDGYKFKRKNPRVPLYQWSPVVSNNNLPDQHFLYPTTYCFDIIVKGLVQTHSYYVDPDYVE